VIDESAATASKSAVVAGRDCAQIDAVSASKATAASAADQLRTPRLAVQALAPFRRGDDADAVDHHRHGNSARTPAAAASGRAVPPIATASHAPASIAHLDTAMVHKLEHTV
jgi:hypothetical protein